MLRRPTGCCSRLDHYSTMWRLNTQPLLQHQDQSTRRRSENTVTSCSVYFTVKRSSSSVAAFAFVQQRWKLIVNWLCWCGHAMGTHEGRKGSVSGVRMVIEYCSTIIHHAATQGNRSRVLSQTKPVPPSCLELVSLLPTPLSGASFSLRPFPRDASTPELLGSARAFPPPVISDKASRGRGGKTGGRGSRERDRRRRGRRNRKIEVRMKARLLSTP